jgi:Mce-associated membrane protein
MADDSKDSAQPGSDAANLADAEVAEAEALATAARARARAIRLRQQAHSVAEAEQTDTRPADSDEPEPHQVGSDGTDEADEAGTHPADGEASRPGQRRPQSATMLTAAVVVLIVALLGASGYIAVRHRDAAQRQQRAAAFTAAARQGVINMTTLNFEHAEDDIQRLLDNSTGEFKDDFAKQADDFVKVAKQTRAVSDGTVNSAAVESMGNDSAVVLVAVTSHVSNAAGANEDPREWRLRVTVTKDGDQIKMSNLVYVP